MRNFYCAVILLFVITSQVNANEQEVFSISVVVTGGEAHKGAIRGSLFASEATYLSESASNDFATVGPEGTVVLDLGQHPAGTYAISVYYDINDNGKLDTGLFRIPKEKIGFSNNARGRFGPAKEGDTLARSSVSSLL